MKDLIAKRYIKALSSVANEDELREYLSCLDILSNAYNISKFREIMEASYICVSTKKELINKVLDKELDAKFSNFINVLAEHKRLDLFCELKTELSSCISALNKEYKAVLISKETYEEDILKDIEDKFGKQLNVKLKLEQITTSNDGIKLVVDDLNIEISFSKEKFINDLKHHILKAF
ncbi:F0F1 ATP synthase subunit delta [Helicobacter ibis]|uniref:F0F1 ATP synthase subunit delta n=1 Tax=Helicobacter ibis TaxID=2962633 RepID=A0ABT4VD41_9HELI|nr:F0F1 ATP synthase subunit delta [Helicobacter ibis]MDA3968615.1 F0F1 ATP synthase subunit delta [Helicobacter ibis]